MSVDIRITEYDNQVYALWKEAFGDSEEDIQFFLTNCRHKICLGLFDNEVLKSMLFLVDCNVNNKLSKYIYAACTDSEHRGKGDMTKLLEYCKKNFCSLCLIPADNMLVDYYSKRGFDEKTSIESIEFNESDEIKEYLFEGYILDEPCALMYKGD